MRHSLDFLHIILRYEYLAAVCYLCGECFPGFGSAVYIRCDYVLLHELFGLKHISVESSAEGHGIRLIVVLMVKGVFKVRRGF